eukprot:283396-Chlamydomonas_euryale.AAC.1
MSIYMIGQQTGWAGSTLPQQMHLQNGCVWQLKAIPELDARVFVWALCDCLNTKLHRLAKNSSWPCIHGADPLSPSGRKRPRG